MKTTPSYSHGGVSGSLIAIILLSLGMVALAGGSIWMYLQYNDATNNLNSKIGVAVAEAQRDQAAKDQEAFLEKEKEPNKQFVGPDDYGRLTFSYPKTWSVYVHSDGAEGEEFLAYLNPGVVPPVESEKSRFAARVKISTESVADVTAEYEDLVEEGQLKSSTVSANGETGTRFDGSFDDNIRGAVVIFKVRDKVIQVFTDANTFKPDFEKLIKTIEFNK